MGSQVVVTPGVRVNQWMSTISQRREALRQSRLAKRKQCLDAINMNGWREGVEFFCEYCESFADHANLTRKVREVMAMPELHWHDVMYNCPISSVIRYVTDESARSFWQWYDDIPKCSRRAFFAGFIEGIDYASRDPLLRREFF